MMYKEYNGYDSRVEEYSRIKIKFPDKLPIICEIDPNDRNIDKTSFTNIKYLVDTNWTVGQFMYVVRKRLKLPSENAVYLTVGSNKCIPPNGEMIGKIYNEYKDNDNFLYMLIQSENFFG